VAASITLAQKPAVTTSIEEYALDVAQVSQQLFKPGMVTNEALVVATLAILQHIFCSHLFRTGCVAGLDLDLFDISGRSRQYSVERLEILTTNLYWINHDCNHTLEELC
jgi:hypothetical protein